MNATKLLFIPALLSMILTTTPLTLAQSQRPGGGSTTPRIENTRRNRTENKGERRNPINGNRTDKHNNYNKHNNKDNKHNNKYDKHNNGNDKKHKPNKPHCDNGNHYAYGHKKYRPVRPGGGYWEAPPVNRYRCIHKLPARPPRYKYIRQGIPSLGSILGLAFGTVIDNSISALLGRGYNVIGYADNAVYLSNVNDYGFVWPEVRIYHNNRGLFSTAHYQYYTTRPDRVRFDNLYNSLCRQYGSPVSSGFSNGINTVSWWAGNNSGYITLQYGPSMSSGGMNCYYTNLYFGGENY